MNTIDIRPATITAASLRAETDESLVALLPTHTSLVVGEMYRRFAPKLRAAAAHRVGEGDADDVVQNVFTVVLAEARFRPAPGRLLPWLAGIAKRVADRRRAEVYRETPVAADEALCDRWIEEIDGPLLEDGAGVKKKRRRR
jgi:DNA-directed RNA polymerase specialized sigma24 family protein